jgi:formylglycine-generating enzyme required for sulfatase activity
VEQVSWYDALEFCNKLSKLEALEPCYTIVATDVAWKRDCNGYRLPTESEWEYAARAGTTTALPNGELSVIDCRRDPKLDDVAWYCANSTVTYKGCLDIAGWGGPKCAGPHPVARKQPNAWGLYDMHGNVMEWVWDWFGAYPDAVTKETADADAVPSGWRRVNRGGGWYNYAKFCRSALRNHDGASARGNGLGFRIVRTDYSK